MISLQKKIFCNVLYKNTGFFSCCLEFYHMCRHCILAKSSLVSIQKDHVIMSVQQKGVWDTMQNFCQVIWIKTQGTLTSCSQKPTPHNSVFCQSNLNMLICTYFLSSFCNHANCCWDIKASHLPLQLTALIYQSMPCFVFMESAGNSPRNWTSLSTYKSGTCNTIVTFPAVPPMVPGLRKQS